MILEQILAEACLLESRIAILNEQIQTLPDGKLICNRNGPYTKWYHNHFGTLQYISKKEKVFAEKLALKKYLSSLLADLLHEQKAINSYLRIHQSYHSQANVLLEETSLYKTLLPSSILSVSEQLSKWHNSSYEQNKNYPEQLIHKTISGNIVRSKSESLIDSALFFHQIPFRYECILHLGEFTFFPDFTICHPKTAKIYYWEHFGMMSDENYSKNAFSKLQIYNSYGLTPSINLITTFETKETPLDSVTIEHIIQHYFL